MLAILNEHADDFDQDIERLGRIVDHLRQVGIRGFVAEHTNDDDFTFREEHPPTISPDRSPNVDELAPDSTDEKNEAPGDTG